jgi:hypothetical protein
MWEAACRGRIKGRHDDRAGAATLYRYIPRRANREYPWSLKRCFTSQSARPGSKWLKSTLGFDGRALSDLFAESSGVAARDVQPSGEDYSFT